MRKAASNRREPRMQGRRGGGSQYVGSTCRTPERVGASGKEHRCSIDAVASLVYPEAPTEFDRLEKARAFAVSQRLTAIENNRHQVEAPSDHVSSPVLTTDVLN